MDEKTRKKVVYIVLAGALIFAAIYFFPEQESKKLTDSPDPSSIATTQTAGLINLDFDRYESLAWGEDPFARRLNRAFSNTIYSDLEKEIDKDIMLNGILYSEADPTVVINGKILKNGDKISDAEILNISKNSVQLKKNDGSVINLSMSKDES